MSVFRSKAKGAARPSTSTDAGKERALTAALSEIEKSYGKGAIMRLGDDTLIKEIRGISSGSISLDMALGGKGFPRGRVVEIFGPESSGKTTLALHAVANAQEEGGICAFVDAARARPGLRPQARGQARRPARQPAQHGRAGARDRRHPND